jgi:hypothetical protein
MCVEDTKYDIFSIYIGEIFTKTIETEVKSMFPRCTFTICNYDDYYENIYLSNTIRCWVESNGIIMGMFLEE